MRRVAAFALSIAVLGCRSDPPRLPVADASCQPPPDDGGTSSCVPPSYLPPAEVTSWREFLATASALVCIDAMRSPVRLPLLDSWCHPRFAEIYLDRHVHEGLPLFPAREARACLEQLEALGGIDAAQWCLGLLSCAAPSECCPERASIGEPCGDDPDCLRELVCDDHTCRPRVGCGERCPQFERCAVDRCVYADGFCADPPCLLGRLGGEPCGCSEDCASGACTAGRCEGLRPIGCPCDGDLDCPNDVARCVDGVCVARPMRGDPCIAGAPCFGSACIDGTCALIPEDEVGCGTARECAPGLVCVEVPCSGLFCISPRVCVRPRVEGAMCDAVHICRGGLWCRDGRCTPRPSIGDACVDPIDCGGVGICSSGWCTAWPQEGEACADDRPCGEGLVCEGGFCRVRGSGGLACDDTRRCNSEHRCVVGRCQPRLGLGEACGSSDACVQSAACIAATCQPRPAIGQPCSGRFDCEDGAMCDDGVCYGPQCR